MTKRNKPYHGQNGYVLLDGGKRKKRTSRKRNSKTIVKRSFVTSALVLVAIAVLSGFAIFKPQEEISEDYHVSELPTLQVESQSRMQVQQIDRPAEREETEEQGQKVVETEESPKVIMARELKSEEKAIETEKPERKPAEIIESQEDDQSAEEVVVVETYEAAEAVSEVQTTELAPAIEVAENEGNYVYNLSVEDKKLIAKLIYLEARYEPFEGKVALAAVVLNRLYTSKPGFDQRSVRSIIYQPGAFRDVDYVTQSELDTVPNIEEAVEQACMGWDPTREVFEGGALFYFAPKYVSGYQKKIREGIKVMQIGGHCFHVDFNT